MLRSSRFCIHSINVRLEGALTRLAVAQSVEHYPVTTSTSQAKSLLATAVPTESLVVWHRPFTASAKVNIIWSVESLVRRWPVRVWWRWIAGHSVHLSGVHQYWKRLRPNTIN